MYITGLWLEILVSLSELVGIMTISAVSIEILYQVVYITGLYYFSCQVP
jgi:hypothetical protein